MRTSRGSARTRRRGSRRSRQEGITVKAVSYPPTETDVTAPLTSAGAASADIVIPGTDANGCVNMANALTQLGITNPQEDRRQPAVPERAGHLGARRLPEVDVRDRELAVSAIRPTRAWRRTRKVDQAVQGHARTRRTRGTSSTSARCSPRSGSSTRPQRARATSAKITPAAVLKIAKAFKGPQALGAPSL